MALGNYKAAVDAGIQKLADIDMQGAKAIAELQMNIEEKNYKRVNEQYDKFQELMKKKNDELIRLADGARDMQKFMMSYSLQEQANQRENQKFEMEKQEQKQKSEADYTGKVALNLVDLDDSLEIIQPTFEEIAAIADELGLDANVLAASVNERIDELRKIKREERATVLSENKFKLDQEEAAFDREKYGFDKYIKLKELDLKTNEASNAGINLTGPQLNDAVKKGYTTEAQMKLYAQQVNSGVTPVTLKEKSAEARKLQANVLTALSSISVIRDQLENSVGRGKLFDANYKSNEANLIEAISNLKTGAAYTEEQLENFRKLLPSVFASDKTNKQKLAELENSFIEVIGKDEFQQAKKEIFVDRSTFESFATIEDKKDFAKFLNDVGADVNDNPDDYFEAYKKGKGLSFSNDLSKSQNGSSKVSSGSIKLGSNLARQNNNPGNLRFVGQAGASQGAGGFARFETPQAGVQALKNQIKLDASRGHTLQSFINKYAPPVENDTGLYVKQVAERLGKNPNTPISSIDLDALTREIMKKESSSSIG